MVHLSTVVKHPHDGERAMFLSFDPCHVFKNVRSQFLERELTDGTGIISGTLVQKLYEHQKKLTIKLARNLTRKRVSVEPSENERATRRADVSAPSHCGAGTPPAELANKLCSPCFQGRDIYDQLHESDEKMVRHS